VLFSICEWLSDSLSDRLCVSPFIQLPLSARSGFEPSATMCVSTDDTGSRPVLRRHGKHSSTAVGTISSSVSPTSSDKHKNGKRLKVCTALQKSPSYSYRTSPAIVSVTCHLPQVNMTHLTSRQAGQHSIYLLLREERLHRLCTVDKQDIKVMPIHAVQKCRIITGSINF